MTELIKKNDANYKRITIIHFKPNQKIFSNIAYNYKTLSERLREAAYLLKGLKIELADDRDNVKEEFQFPDGLKSFVQYLNEEKDSLHEVFSFDGINQEIEVDFAFQFNDGYSENMLSYVNHR